MKELVKTEVYYIGSLFNLIIRVSPKLALRIALRLVSILSKRKLSTKEKEFYKLGKPMTLKVENKEYRGCIWGDKGPTILLVHGWKSNSASWKKYISHFTQKGYKVLAFDAPGHGLNKNKKFEIALYFKMVEKIISETDKHYAIIGHSIGATASFFGVKKHISSAPKKMILISPYNSISYLAITMAKFLKLNNNFVKEFNERILLELNHSLDELEISKQVKNIKSYKISIIHSTDDPVIDFSESKKVKNNSFDNLNLDLVEGAKHSKSHPNIFNAVIKNLN